LTTFGGERASVSRVPALSAGYARGKSPDQTRPPPRSSSPRRPGHPRRRGDADPRATRGRRRQPSLTREENSARGTIPHEFGPDRIELEYRRSGHRVVEPGPPRWSRGRTAALWSSSGLPARIDAWTARSKAAYARSGKKHSRGRELDALDAITSPEFVNHNALPGTPPGPEGHRQVVERLWNGLPDAHFQLEHLGSDGDTVICIGTMWGTTRACCLGSQQPAGGSSGASATCTASTRAVARSNTTRSAMIVSLLRQFAEGGD
jgi:hypothetical protein